MALTPGVRLGVYEVIALVGAGGMGEVYRARDTRLGRDVALKVLPDAFTADPDRRDRFEREARVLASLSHPHIGGIYGLEEAGGVTALVLSSSRARRSPCGFDGARCPWRKRSAWHGR
jgi:serine/threonine protein kinase